MTSKIHSLGALLMFASLSWAQQAPAGLAVKAATSKKIDLTWSGGTAGYTVQRRTLGAAYSDLATVTTASYSDTSVDAYTTYQYQIVANLASGASSPSNQVTVGPPPTGFTVAAQAGAGSDAADNYGYDLSMALDGNGDPAFAFIQQDPNLDDNYKDTQVLFRSWNRAAYRWNAISTVAVVGDAATYYHNTLSLAYDSSTGAFAVFTEQEGDGAFLYTSADGGASWALKTSFIQNDRRATSPVVLLSGGNVYLASIINNVGARYVTGKLSADPSTWQAKTAPVVAGTTEADASVTMAMALDSAGNPGIAYWTDDTGKGYNRVLLYWRPAGSAAPTKIMDSQGVQSDNLSVRMVYRNLNPRVLAFVARSDAAFGVGVHFVKSDNGGASWGSVVVIPPDTDSSTDFPFDLAIDSQDHGAAGFGQNSSSGNFACLGPKLALSTDLTAWKTCGLPNAASAGNFQGYPGAIAMAYGGNDKLLFLWWDTQASPAGIYLYREPPAGQSNTPSISSVVNGATFQSGIVAGSWVTITGAQPCGHFAESGQTPDFVSRQGKPAADQSERDFGEDQRTGRAGLLREPDADQRAGSGGNHRQCKRGSDPQRIDQQYGNGERSGDGAGAVHLLAGGQDVSFGPVQRNLHHCRRSRALRVGAEGKIG